jgi:hypothetical protein
MRGGTKVMPPISFLRNYNDTDTEIYRYSGPSNFERFDVRTTWNSNKKFEENPVLKLEQKFESRAKNHVVAFSLYLVQMKEG